MGNGGSWHDKRDASELLMNYHQPLIYPYLTLWVSLRLGRRLVKEETSWTQERPKPHPSTVSWVGDCSRCEPRHSYDNGWWTHWDRLVKCETRNQRIRYFIHVKDCMKGLYESFTSHWPLPIASKNPIRTVEDPTSQTENHSKRTVNKQTNK